MKKTIKWLAFLVLFTAAAVGVTYGLIQYELQKQQPRPEPAPAEEGIDLNGFYDRNDLIFTEQVEAMGERELRYPQIDGLKDAAAEDAANAAIAEAAEELKAYYADSGKTMNYLTYSIYANYANVLSIGLFSADSEYNSRQVYVNINLNDGSLLKLSDLFTAQADVHSIVRAGFYDALTRHNLTENYWEGVSSPDENELYKTVRGYMAAEKKQFAFSPAEIYLYYENYTAVVPMVEYAEDIALYHRFLSEGSLFERDDIGYKNIFTCADFPDGYVRREYGYAEENFWYDIAQAEPYFDESIPAEIRDRVNECADALFNSLMDEMRTVTAAAQANPDRAYILLASPDVSLYSDAEYVGDDWTLHPSKAVRVNEGYTLYEMDRDLFESKYRDALVAEYRSNPYYLLHGGIDEDIDGDEVICTKRNDERLFLYETGEELNVNTVFVEGYDHFAAVRAQTKYNLMSYYGYSLEEAEQVTWAVWYELAGTGLKVHVPALPEENYFWMSLNEFNREHLTIFQ